LRLLSISLARRWLLTLIVSELAVFAGSYFYFTAMHALESFDTGSCIPLTLDSSSAECVSSLQALLNDDHLYSTISIDGYFDRPTMEAVIVFQSAHHLTVDGIVGSQTAEAINEFSPRPSALSYADGFVNSKLSLSVKLCVAALMMAVTIICLLLRAARIGPGSRIRIRCCLAGFFAALMAVNSAAAGSLMTEAHSWVAKFFCFVLVGLTAALARLIKEMFPGVTALSDFAGPMSGETQPQMRDTYGP
jgi:Putative peptidoglycan binding domain